MKTRYSKTTGAFYPLDIDYVELPTDVVEVSIEDYHMAMSRPVGFSFDFVDGELVIIAPPAPTLGELKAAKLVEVNVAAQAIADGMTADYPAFERDTWPDQKAEALAWNADNAVATPFLDKMAAYRGIDPLLYREKTLAKVQTYLSAGQYLAGKRQHYEDQIKAVKVEEGEVDEEQAKVRLALIVPVFDLSEILP